MNPVIQSISNMKFMKADRSIINAWVKFTHLDDVVPFTITSNDPEQYGKELFEKAISGEYGPISVYEGLNK